MGLGQRAQPHCSFRADPVSCGALNGCLVLPIYKEGVVQLTTQAQTIQALDQLNRRVVRCRRCPRLVTYLEGIREKHPDWWCKPVPGFGDPHAQVVLLGLAPGQGGSNRSGRMFTGDASGTFLFKALHEAGLCSQPVASSTDDGLRLINCYITAVGRCAPPQNKPTPEELRQCERLWVDELELLPKTRVLVALGQIAHTIFMRQRQRAAGLPRRKLPFSHGAVHEIPGRPEWLVDSYHPSRQNTQTGRLTPAMFRSVFRTVRRLIESS